MGIGVALDENLLTSTFTIAVADHEERGMNRCFSIT